jgi:hypothetical protein
MTFVRFLSFVFVFLTVATTCFSQLPASLGKAQGIYKTVDPGFECLDYFELKRFPNQDPDNPSISVSGEVEITGRLVLASKKVLKFKTARVSVLHHGSEDVNFKYIEFATECVDGDSFQFKGYFLENWFEKSRSGPWIKVQGTLTKLKDGKVLSSNPIDIYRYAVE